MNKIIYSLKVMRQLVERGFIPKASMPNPTASQYTCWIFEDTPKFEEVLTEILGGVSRD